MQLWAPGGPFPWAQRWRAPITSTATFSFNSIVPAPAQMSEMPREPGLWSLSLWHVWTVLPQAASLRARLDSVACVSPPPVGTGMRTRVSGQGRYRYGYMVPLEQRLAVQIHP